MPKRKHQEQGDTAVVTEDQVKTEKPRLWKVILHNDDYTTMEFVVEVLITVFRKSMVEATRIMLTVHRGGRGIAGVYTKEVAETKATQATERAQSAGYPLLVTTEPDPQ